MTSARTIYRRTLRWIIPFIMTLSVVSGLASLFVVRASSRTSLIETQGLQLRDVFTQLQEEINFFANEAIDLANDRSVRAFARDTLLPGSTSLNNTQIEMLNDFVQIIEDHPETIVSVRYVTSNGAVWSQAQIDDNGIIGIATDLRLAELVDDPLIGRVATLTPNNAIGDGVYFRRTSTLSFNQRQRPIVRIAAPASAGTELATAAGMVLLELDLTAILREQVVAINANLEEPGRRIVLIDSQGNVLYNSADSSIDYLGALFSGSPIIAAEQFPAPFLSTAGGDPAIVGPDVVSSIILPLDTTGGTQGAWQALMIDNETLALSSAVALGLGLFVSIQLFSLVLIVFISTTLRRSLRPIDDLRTSATAIVQTVAAAQRLPSARSTQEIAPLITVMAPSANVPASIATTQEASDLLGMFQVLSARVAELQRDLDTQRGRYTRNIDVAARVSRETATLNNIDSLLNRAIRQLCEEYGFYHAQVFLLDDVNEYAVLVYSYGERGRQLLERGHKLAVGSASVIGTVTVSGRAAIVNDTQAPGSTHKFNPLLPDTRAELALPLQFGDRVIGALDIQSVAPNVFPPEEVRIFQMIADQIAVAIQNVRLLTQSEQRFAELNSLNRQLGQGVLASGDGRGRAGVSYTYDMMRVVSGAPEPSPGAVSVPIIIRGETVGTIEAQLPEFGTFSVADRALVSAVAERVGVAIENTRLYEETQNTLGETFTLYQLSRLLNEATALEDIISAVVTSVMPDALAGQIAIFDEYPDGMTPQWLEFAADWQAEHGKREVILNGLQLRFDDHRIVSSMTPTQVVLVNDVERDSRIDDVFRAVFSSIGARSMVFIPFNVRGVWRGLLLVEFAFVRAFSEREGRIFSALIDQAGVAIDARLLLRQNEVALADIERLYIASRIINTAQNMAELVRAAVETAGGPGLDFELGAFSGDLDATGWATHLHLVARSVAGKVIDSNEVLAFNVPYDSPLRRRDPLRLQDSDEPNTSPLAAYLRSRGARYVTILPLFSVNQPLALFFILGNDTRYLGEDEIEVYRALTGQMSTVLQNRRLLEQTERTLDETRRLYAANRAITSAVNAAAVHVAGSQSITRDNPFISRLSILTAPGANINSPYLDYAHAYLRDPDTQTDFRAGLRVPRAAIPLAQIVQDEGGTVMYGDVAAQARDYETVVAMADRNGTRAMMLVPIEMRQRFFGLVMVESDQVRAFNEPFANFVQAVTDQMATAINGILAFEEAQLQAQRALALAQAGQLAAAVGGDFAESVGEVFNQVATPAQYDRWLLALVSDDGLYLEKVSQRLPGVTQSGNEQAERYNLETDRTPLVQAFVQNRMLLVNEPGAFPSLETLPEPVLNLFGKHLVAPVRLGGQVIGAIMVGRARTATDLDENDEQLVKTLSAQIAVAVENRRLFAEAENERQRLSTVLNTLPAGVAVLDPATFFPIQRNEQAVVLLGNPLTELMAVNTETLHLRVSGTSAPYPDDELPFRLTALTGLPASRDNIALVREDGVRVDLLVTAAPVLNEQGEVTAVVTAFQDISSLRNLERTLEGNLYNTLALFETSRELSATVELDEVLDRMIERLINQVPDEAYLVLFDADTFETSVARTYRRDEDNSDEQFESTRVDLSSGAIPGWTLPDELLVPDQPLFINDISQTDALDEGLRLALLRRGVQAVTVLVMRARRDVPLGWMVLAYHQPTASNEEDEQFLLTFNDTASIALDNRYLNRSTATALEETGKLYDATAIISRARSLPAISDALQRLLVSISPDQYAAVIRLESGEVRTLFSVAMDSEPFDLAGLLKRHPLNSLPTTFIDDLHLISQPNPLEADLLSQGNLRAVALLPLQSKDQNTGVLFVGYHFPRRFQGSEGRYLNTLADSTSTVVDNFLLLERIQRTLDETSKQYQASRALADASEPDEILSIVSEYLVDTSAKQAFIVQLLSPTWDAPGSVARVAGVWAAQDSSSVDLTGISLGAEQYPAWRLLSSTSTVVINDVETAPDLSDMERMGLSTLDLASLVVLPLRVGGRALGCIVIGSDEPHQFSDRELRIYRSFTEQASLRLEATRSLRQAERRARQLVTSSEVSQIAGSLLDLDALLPEIVDLIRDRFEYDHVQIFLMDKEDNYAMLRASTGEPGRQLLSIRHKLQKGSQSVIGQVTARGVPTIAADTADARVTHRPNPYLPNTRSEMAIPLKLKGRTIGALDVQSNNANAFDDDDVIVLTTLAGQVATAIDNAQLYDDARSRATEMSFLYSVTTAAASATTLEEAAQNLAEELNDSLSAASVAIYLPEQYVDVDDSEFTLLIPIALAGSDQPLSGLSEIRLDTAQNLIASVATSRVPLIVPDIANETRYLPVVEQARSLIIVPLTNQAQLVSVIAMESDQAGRFDESTLQLLLTLSGSLSAIVQNQQLLEQIKTQNDALRELDRLKSDFLANMSHELRTPLNSIIGFSRVILKGIDGPLTEMQEQDLTTIYNSGMHLLNLINDILDQAKIAAGKMDLQYDFFEPKTVIDGVRSIGIGLVKDKPIDIIVDIAPMLPKAYGDEFRTRQVLLNLVSNAAKFTREGSITISAYPVRDGETNSMMVRIDVTDTGIGIADKDIPLLFEAFRQVDSSLTRTAGGTGLGLPIAKSLVEMQGGRMFVHSVVNVGSTFSILMPVEAVVMDEETPKRKTDNLDEARPSTRSASSRGVTGHLRAPADMKTNGSDMMDTNPDITRIMTRRRQILLIEDNPEMVDQFRRALAREGFEIFAATIPLEAEAMASGLHPNIIIMDVNFSNGSGWSILRNLKGRDDTVDIPVIIVSLSTDAGAIMDAGAFKFIRRPFLPEDIVDAVKAAERESHVERILIIDDQADHARLMQQILMENGPYKVFIASNGAEGIAMVARRRPNLILLDLRMPEMDGFQVVKELRSNPETATIPIVIVTGETLTTAERDQLMNLAVLFKSNIASNEYRELLDGVTAFLDRN